MSDTAAWALIGFGVAGLAFYGALFMLLVARLRWMYRRRRIRRCGCWEVKSQ